MGVRPIADRINRDSSEDDRALDGPLPIRAHAEERQRGSHGAEEHDTEQGATDRPAAAGNRRAANDDGGDDLELEPKPGVARNLVEADGIEHGGEAGQAAGDDEDSERD